MKTAIIMANEKRSKIDSENPTVLNKIIDKPMIKKVVDNFVDLEFDNIISVIDYDKEKIVDLIGDKSDYIEVSESKKMFNAVNSIEHLKDKEGYTLVTDATVPLITKTTYKMMLELITEYPMVVLTADTTGYSGFDIVTRNPEKAVRSIIRYEDASADQKAIREVNMNVYAFNNRLLYKYLKELEIEQDFYDVTDLVRAFKSEGHRIMPLQLVEAEEAIRITTRKDLVKANDWESCRINNYWLENGVTIHDTKSTTIGANVKIGNDTTIYPNNRIIGNTIIGKYNTIESNNKIINSQIGDNNTIERSIINESIIGNNNDIGPWTNIRVDVKIGDYNRVGSNVELKNTVINNHNAIAHNAYLGDTVMGNHNNIGWGVVTANYDGNNKHQTTIGNNSFVGSSTTIIAPMTIGDKVLVAAGSTINENIEDDALAIARGRQKNMPDRGKEYLERKE